MNNPAPPDKSPPATGEHQQPKPAVEREAENLLNEVETFAGGDTDVGPTSTA